MIGSNVPSIISTVKRNASLNGEIRLDAWQDTKDPMQRDMLNGTLDKIRIPDPHHAVWKWVGVLDQCPIEGSLFRLTLTCLGRRDTPIPDNSRDEETHQNPNT